MSAGSSRARTVLVWGLLGLVVGLGAFVRFYRLGAKSLWLDEVAAMGFVGRPVPTVLLGVDERGVHPPLYCAALKLWMVGSGGAVWARALSAGAGVATLLVFYALARLMVPRWAAVAGVGVLAVSAHQVYFAQEVGPQALTVLFVVASWYCLAELVAGRRLERWPMWLALAATNTAALYTSAFAVCSVAAQVVAVVLVWREVGRKLIVPWAVWQLLPVSAFAGYVAPMALGRLRAAAAGAGGPLARMGGLGATAEQFGGGYLRELWSPWGTVAAAAAGVLALLVVGAAVLAARRCWTAAALALAWLLAPVGCLAVLSATLAGLVCEPRQVLFAAPGLALAAATALAGSRGRLRAGVVGLVVLLGAANGVSLARYYGRGIEKADWRGAVAAMAERVEPGDIVCFNPASGRLPFHVYYAGPAVVRRLAPREGRPFREGELARGRRLWLFQVDDGAGEPNAQVAAALAPYPQLLYGRYVGLEATIDLWLYDTRRRPPAAPR